MWQALSHGAVYPKPTPRRCSVHRRSDSCRLPCGVGAGANRPHYPNHICPHLNGHPCLASVQSTDRDNGNCGEPRCGGHVAKPNSWPACLCRGRVDRSRRDVVGSVANRRNNLITVVRRGTDEDLRSQADTGLRQGHVLMP